MARKWCASWADSWDARRECGCDEGVAGLEVECAGVVVEERERMRG
jgi:DUF2075 family protein